MPNNDVGEVINSLPGTASAPDTETDDQLKKSTATVLVELAMAGYTFGVTSTGDAFAVPKTGPRIVAMLRGAKMSLRAHLAKRFFGDTQRAASQNSLSDAMATIEGFAQEEDETELFTRVVHINGESWLDLGDLTGLAVCVTPSGWSIGEPPILFKRTALNSPLPVPVPGGDIDELWSLLNVADSDKPLILAWIVATFFHDIPHPILAIFGEQGTGKSTALKRIVSCTDPSPVPLRKPPKTTDAWVSAAAGSWVVGIDNLSYIPEDLSDSLCRAVTGDGDVRRKLYTDGDHSVFSFRRCVVINGIDVGSLRGDLSERLLPVHLELISEDSRLEERDMEAVWADSHPKILGAILDVVAAVLQKIPSVELDRKPRMADFARILAGVDAVLNTDGLETYRERQNDIAADSLAGDPLMASLVGRQGERWEGTSRELYALLTPTKPPKGWPSSSRQVTARLKRNAPSLRKIGWEVRHDDGKNHRNVVLWTITPPTRGGVKPPSQPSHPRAFDQKTTNSDNQPRGCEGKRDGFTPTLVTPPSSEAEAQPCTAADYAAASDGDADFYGPDS